MAITQLPIIPEVGPHIPVDLMAWLDLTNSRIRELITIANGSNTLKDIPGIVYGVLRNTGSGWSLLDDGDHVPCGIASVTNSTSTITVNFAFTSSVVGTFLAVPDETLVNLGYNFGASVGFTAATITIARCKPVGGYIAYDGANWVIDSNSVGITGASFNTGTGLLTITHDDVGMDVRATCCERSGGSADAYIYYLGTNSMDVVFRTKAGTGIATPNTDMRVFVTREPGPSVNPNNVVSATGNIWLFGAFEV